MGKPYKLILWGLGKEYNSHVMCLKHQESLNEIRINAVTANEIPHYSRIDGWPLIEKEKIKGQGSGKLKICGSSHHV